MQIILITGAAIVAVSMIRGWIRSGKNLEQIKQHNAGEPSSWQGSAEQKMLHANDEIRRRSSDRPY
jgi:hypothetical protein